VHASRHLAEHYYEMVNLLERIAAWCYSFQFTGENPEFQSKFLKHLVPPLLDQASWRNDDDAPGVGAHNEFADVEARHDGLAGAGIVGEDEPKRLARQHGFIDGRDLVGERLHVGRVYRHHWVEQEREVDAARLDRELEGFTATV